MKRKVSLFLSMLFVLTSVMGSFVVSKAESMVSGKNLIVNGDFEKGFEGWERAGHLEDVVDGAGLDSSKAFKTIGKNAEGQNDSWYNAISQAIELEADSYYMYSYVFKGQGAVNCYFGENNGKININNKLDGEQLSWESEIYVSGKSLLEGTVYKRMTYMLHTPDGETNKLPTKLIVMGAYGNDTAYVDDITLVKVEDPNNMPFKSQIGTNLVKNGDFENGDNDWSYEVGQDHALQEDPCELPSVVSGGVDGGNALRLYKDWCTYARQIVTDSLLPGATYRLSLDYKGNARVSFITQSNGEIVYFRDKDINNTEFNEGTSGSFPVTGDQWGKFVKTFTVSSDLTKAQNALVQISGWGGATLIDNVKLEQVGPNHGLFNGSFEYGTPDNDVGQWYNNDAGNKGTFIDPATETEPFSAIDGSKVLKLNASSGGGVSQVIPVVENGYYSISYYLRGTANNRRLYIVPEDGNVYENNQATVGTINQTPQIISTSEDGWTHFLVAFKAENTIIDKITKKVRICIRALSSGDPIYLDDIKVTKIEPVNHLYNGSFEFGLLSSQGYDEGSTGPFGGWVKNNDAHIAYSVDGTPAIDGKGMMVLPATNNTNTVFQRVAFTEGNKYLLTYYQKGDTASVAVMGSCQTQWGTSGHEGHSYQSPVQATTTVGEPDANGWVKKELRFTAKNAFDEPFTSALIVIRRNADTSNPPAYIDDMKLEQQKADVPVIAPESVENADAPVDVTMTAETGAKIYYTTDGSAPTAGSTEYTGAIAVGYGESKNIKAITVADGKINSDVATASYSVKARAQTPVILPASLAPEDAPINVTITAEEGAAIHYTTDNSVPTVESDVYEGPINLGYGESKTIKAIAIVDGKVDSDVASASYTVKAKLTAPVISPESTSDSNAPINVTITAETGAKIYYTTDGSAPTANSTEYTGAITVGYGESKTIKAIAVENGKVNSDTTEASFSVKAKVGDVVFNPEAGTKYVDEGGKVSVTLTAEEGAHIYYTIDGAQPSAESTKYEAPIELGVGNTTVKAIAIKSGCVDSNVVTAAYEVEVGTQPTATPTETPVIETPTPTESTTPTPTATTTATSTTTTVLVNKTAYVPVSKVSIAKVAGTTKTTAKVTVYKKAATNKGKWTTVSKNKTIKVKSVSGNYAKVTVKVKGKTRTGYVKVTSLKFGKTQAGKVTASTKAYKKASTKNGYYESFSKNKKFTIKSRSGSYYTTTVKVKTVVQK